MDTRSPNIGNEPRACRSVIAVLRGDGGAPTPEKLTSEFRRFVNERDGRSSASQL
jgi:hypothetical protein